MLPEICKFLILSAIKICNPASRESNVSESLGNGLNEKAEFGQSRCHCGKFLLRKMESVEYGPDWHLRVWPEPIGDGGTAKVFHAQTFPSSEGHLDLPQCVALKSVLLEKVKVSDHRKILNEQIILNEFAKHKAKRIIRLFSDKHFSDQLLLLMELGTKTFQEELDDLEKHWASSNVKPEEKDIIGMFKDVLEAVKEMHTMVMHLDLKPANLLYVNVPNGMGGFKRILKIIDFGGSEIIPDGKDHGKDVVKHESRANLCKQRSTFWGNNFYSAPEQNNCIENSPESYQLSTKADIWALGVILLMMSLKAPVFHGISARVQIMCWTENMFITIFPPNICDSLNATKSKVKAEFPRLFNIVQATLNRKPADRPTARGILIYLNGKCHLKMPLEEHLAEGSDASAKAAENAIVDAKHENHPRQLDATQNVKQTASKNSLPECDTQTTGSILAHTTDQQNEKEEKHSTIGEN